jgi:uncharacterized membrane protein YraQ (UPF0718 family)
MQQEVSNIAEQFLLVFFIAGRTLLGLVPYILGGIILGEIFRNLPWIDRFSHWCHKSTLVALLLAAIIGVISPLCTYGTIPLILMLSGKGFPLPPLITFLLASSSLNPQLFFVTLGGINPEMALVRLFTVLFFSILVGFVMRFIPKESILVSGRNTDPDKNIMPVHNKDERFRISLKSIWKELKYIGFFILIGCIAGAIIEVFIPTDSLSSLFRSGPVGSVLIATILGVPVYVCGGGVIPVIGTLLSKGMNAGAALSFLTAGQAVRITPLTALASLIRVRYLIFFVISIIIYSIIIGLIYQLIA